MQQGLEATFVEGWNVIGERTELPTRRRPTLTSEPVSRCPASSEVRAPFSPKAESRKHVMGTEIDPNTGALACISVTPVTCTELPRI